jgi:hypothetical protein
VLAQQVLEQLQAIRIHQGVEDHRVVERPSGEVIVRAGVQRQRAELRLRRAEQHLALGECDAVSVGLAQVRGEADQETGEHQGVAPVRRRLLERHAVVAARKKQHRAAVADKVGEGLVEVGVAADVTGVVQQFVDDHGRQRGAVVAQQIGEQRVGKPPECAERHRRADVGVVAVAFEACGFLLRGACGEVALVWDAADDREPPRVRLQLQLIRRRHHVDHLVGVDLRHRAVAVADTQVQGVAREEAHGEHQLELLAADGVEVAALQHFSDRFPAPQDLRLLVAGAQDVAGGAGGEAAAGQHAKRKT